MGALGEAWYGEGAGVCQKLLGHEAGVVKEIRGWKAG